jgi:hypothetical protein
MGCPKNWVPGTFEKLEVPLCSEFSGDPGNAIKKFFLRRSELRTYYVEVLEKFLGRRKKLLWKCSEWSDMGRK